jgi:hypothetical protein
MSDDETIPILLRIRAEALGLVIEVLDDDYPFDPELDLGRFMLLDPDGGGAPIWAHGLPLTGIADALNCFAREDGSGDAANIEGAWRDFGASWR